MVTMVSVLSSGCNILVGPPNTSANLSLGIGFQFHCFSRSVHRTGGGQTTLLKIDRQSLETNEHYQLMFSN